MSGGEEGGELNRKFKKKKKVSTVLLISLFLIFFSLAIAKTLLFLILTSRFSYFFHFSFIFDFFFPCIFYFLLFSLFLFSYYKRCQQLSMKEKQAL